MASKTFSVRLLIDHFYARFVKPDSTSAATQLNTFVDEILQSKARIDNGIATVTFANVSYTFRPSYVPVIETADGGIATDITIFCRWFLMSLLGPTVGQRMTRDPRATAEYVRAFCMRFWSGATCGGAILDSGKWFVSPHWMPIPAPNPVEAVSASFEDPVSRTLRRWSGETQAGENTQKGANTAADPYFALLAAEGNTEVVTFPYTCLDLQELDWSVALVHAGGDATDVVTRGATMGEPSDDPAHWMSDAYEDLITSGFLMSALQMPRACLYNRLLERLSREGATGAYSYWFRGFKKDYKLRIDNWEAVELVRADPYSYKMSYLDSLRGIPLIKPRRTTALMGSPLGGIIGSADFKEALTKPFLPTLTLTATRRSWIRSDPACPEAIKWLADSSYGTVSQAWFPETADAYFNLLLTK